jgi:hypothetical protein
VYPWASRYVLEVSILARSAPAWARMSGARREATRDYSTVNSAPSAARRGGFPLHVALRASLALSALAGAALLVVATFSTIIQIKVVTTGDLAANVDTTLSGTERHGVALIIFAGAALVMLLGALRGSKPAMFALTVLGIAALAVTIGQDAPDVHDTGIIGQLYDSATAGPKIGFYLETLGAALVFIAGGGLLVLGTGEAEADDVALRPGAADAAADH